MARSRRHLPIFGITTATSDKDDKVRGHRAERAAVRTALVAGTDAPHPKQYGDPWSAAKDGKRYWTKAQPADMRK